MTLLSRSRTTLLHSNSNSRSFSEACLALGDICLADISSQVCLPLSPLFKSSIDRHAIKKSAPKAECSTSSKGQQEAAKVSMEGGVFPCQQGVELHSPLCISEKPMLLLLH